MATSIHEVARLANVSVPTVSNVVHNRSDRFSDETYKRVKRIIRETGYQPNRSAQLLRGAATHTLGVLSHGLSGYSQLNHADMIACLDQTLRARDYRTLMGFWWNNSDRLRDHLDEMIAHRVEGIVISCALGSDEHRNIVREVLPANLPLLVIDNKPWGTCDSIEIDRCSAMLDLTRHLIGLGHSHFAYACSTRTYNRIKVPGIAQALREAGLPWDSQRILDGADGLDYASDLAPKLMALDPKPTAIICSNDYIAIGMMRGLRKMGLDIPGDVSVTGYDGIWVSQIAEVPLTTLRQPREQMGTRAAEMMLERIKNPDRPPCREWFKPELVVRESIGVANPRK